MGILTLRISSLILSNSTFSPKKKTTNTQQTPLNTTIFPTNKILTQPKAFEWINLQSETTLELNNFRISAKKLSRPKKSLKVNHCHCPSEIIFMLTFNGAHPQEEKNIIYTHTHSHTPQKKRGHPPKRKKQPSVSSNLPSFQGQSPISPRTQKTWQ